MNVRFLVLAGAWLSSMACATPSVQVQAPDKPIEINMNIKIEHEIRIAVEKDVEELFEGNEDLFGER